MATTIRADEQARRDAKRKEIEIRYKRKRRPFNLYDAQIAALYKLRKHRLETDGDVSSADQIAAIIANMRISRTGRKADKLGEAVELTDAERTLLGIRVIAPCDLGKADREQRVVKSKRERERYAREFDRRLAGKPARMRRFADSAKPWESAGVSRATWYRQRVRLSATDTSAVPGETLSATDTLKPQSHSESHDLAPAVPSQKHLACRIPASAVSLMGRTNDAPPAPRAKDFDSYAEYTAALNAHVAQYGWGEGARDAA